MCRAYKRSAQEKNSEDGFVLVAALIAVMILTALGIWALTTSSQDIKATARSVSEGNALSAAEAGVHIYVQTSILMCLSIQQRPTITRVPQILMLLLLLRDKY